MAAKAERASFDAKEQIQDHLEAGKLSANQLVPIFGVLVDKCLALREDPNAINSLQFHEHSHIHSHLPELNAETLAKLKASLPD